MNSGSDIKHISDTAIWVATYRAQESERRDALFQDPFAAVLAGERGKRIAAAMPYPRIMYWVLVLRTVAIDRLIAHALSLGIDAVVNVGAGLDTRPYRMALPATLHWIEIDFPDMISFKNERLKVEQPVCRLERIAADLADLPLRRAIFDRIGSESKKVLVITEGVVPYLSNEEAASLSRDLFAVPSFQYWIQDYRQGGLKRWSSRKVKQALKDTPFKFDTPDWLSFFTEQGWMIRENCLAADLSDEIKRPFPFIFPWSLLLYVLPKKVQDKWRRSSGYVMYQKP